MPRIAPFESHHERYDQWFTRHEAAYYSELLAIRALLPWQGRSLEVGVGTARFAAPLGIPVGIDPSPAMRRYAAQRGVEVLPGVAEDLPFADGSFESLLSVTTICFVDDVARMLGEAHRILAPGGHLVLGFIDRGSRLGQEHLCTQLDNVFYREATFFSAREVDDLLADTGFGDVTWLQTLTTPLAEVEEIEPVQPGHGEGLFVGVRARARR
jgi:SAM-dependent methyltransferase